MRTAVSCLALMVSLASGAGVGYQFYQQKQTKGIDKYDFSSPALALRSACRMEVDLDISASLEYRRKTQGEQDEEKLTTLEVVSEVEWHGDKILFYKFKKKGITNYEIMTYTKHAKSGYWVYKYISRLDLEKENKELADRMKRWEESGSLEPVAKK